MYTIHKKTNEFCVLYFLLNSEKVLVMFFFFNPGDFYHHQDFLISCNWAWSACFMKSKHSESQKKKKKNESPGKYWSVAKWTRDISHWSKVFLETLKDSLILGEITFRQILTLLGREWGGEEEISHPPHMLPCPTSPSFSSCFCRARRVCSCSYPPWGQVNRRLQSGSPSLL